MLAHEFSLEGKVALVTGASRGIGRAIAECFAQHGASVVLASRKQAGVDEAAEAIRAQGGTATAIACHTGQSSAIAELFGRIQSDFGRLDILVNNAATNPYFGPILDAPETAFDKTFEVNCRGYFLVAQHAARIMAAQQSGSIVNIASVEGLSPSPMMGIYAMTKAAVIALTKSLAKELGAAGVRCNCLCPGLTETHFARTLIDTPEIHQIQIQRTPLGRHAQPSEMAGAVLYLASDASSFTTGAVLVCDGGAIA